MQEYNLNVLFYVLCSQGSFLGPPLKIAVKKSASKISRSLDTNRLESCNEIQETAIPWGRDQKGVVFKL